MEVHTEMKTDGKPSGTETTDSGRKLWVMVLVPLFIVVLVVLAVMIAFNLHAQQTLVDSQVNDRNNLLANVVKNSIFDALSTGDNDVVRSQFARLQEELPGVSIYVYDFHSKVSFSTDSAAVGVAMDRVVEKAQAVHTIGTVLKEGKNSTTTADLSGEPHSFTHLPIFNERSCHHCHGQTQTVLGGITVASNLATAAFSLALSAWQSLSLRFTGCFSFW
jgi:methyl-accepting chemotaxis protein